MSRAHMIYADPVRVCPPAPRTRACDDTKKKQKQKQKKKKKKEEEEEKTR